VTVAAAAAAADAGVIADEPSASSATEEFGRARDEHTSFTRHVAAIWKNLRTSQSLVDVDVQFQTTEYRDEMTMDSLIEGADCTVHRNTPVFRIRERRHDPGHGPMHTILKFKCRRSSLCNRT